MLSDYIVLKYIQENLQAPFSYNEKNTDEILSYIKEFSLREFTKYIPDVYRLYIDTTDDRNIVENSNNTKFYINDPDDTPIVTVKKLYASNTDIILGHPVIGVSSTNELNDWLLDTFNSNLAKPFSMYSYEWHYHHPNILEIIPYPGPFSIEYERQHMGFHTIPAQWETDFLKLALGDALIWHGRIRTRFGGMTTPFGDIQLNGDAMIQEGKELKEFVLNDLRALCPNEILDLL